MNLIGFGFGLPRIFWFHLMWPLLSSTTFSGSAVRKNTSWLIWDFIRLCPFQPCLCHLLLESLMLLLEVGGSDAGRADDKLLVAPLALFLKDQDHRDKAVAVLHLPLPLLYQPEQRVHQLGLESGLDHTYLALVQALNCLARTLRAPESSASNMNQVIPFSSCNKFKSLPGSHATGTILCQGKLVELMCVG